MFLVFVLVLRGGEGVPGGWKGGKALSQPQLLFTSNCQAVVSGEDARCHLQPGFLWGNY